MRRLWLLAVLAVPALAGDVYVRSALAKIHSIEEGRAARGSVVYFSLQEINSWAYYMVPQTVPEGIRKQRVTLGEGFGSAYALMDFLKMRHARGKADGWILQKLIEGERPVVIAIRLDSPGGGFCTVYLTRVEISGVVASGSVLDFMVKTFFLPLYPNAHINERFEIGYGIDRIEIHPAGVRVTMKK